MWKYLPLIALLTASCATYDDAAVGKKPTNDFYTNKTTKEVMNCIKSKWIINPPLTDIEVEGGYKVYSGIGSGAGATVVETERGTHVTSYIPSAGWAVIPKKLAKGVESCR